MQVKPARERIPLCVVVYDRILEALRESGLRPGEEIPGEVQLAADLQVSRTVAREALLLLEEDGVLVRRSGRRRTLAPARTNAADFNSGIEHLLDATEVSLDSRLQARIVPTDAFTRDHLETSSDMLMWESTWRAGASSIGSSLEFMSSSLAPPELLAPAARSSDSGASGSLLSAVGPARRARWTPFLWRFTLASPKTERMTWSGLPARAVPAMLVVGLAERGRPVYLAKHLLDLSKVSVTVDIQATAGTAREQTGMRLISSR